MYTYVSTHMYMWIFEYINIHMHWRDLLKIYSRKCRMVCTYIYIYMYLHTCICEYINILTYICSEKVFWRFIQENIGWYVYIYTYMYLHTCICEYINILTYICIEEIFEDLFKKISDGMYIYMYISTHMYMCYLNMWTCICTQIYICMNTYIHVHRTYIFE
jgi:hypothetical protein